MKLSMADVYLLCLISDLITECLAQLVYILHRNSSTLCLPFLLADNSCSPNHIPASPLRFPILEPEHLIIKYTPNVFRLNKSVLFSRPIRNVTVRTMTSIRIHVYSVIGQTGMKASGYLTIWMIWTLTNSDITWGQESGNSYFKYHRTEDRREIGIVFSSYTYFELFFFIKLTFFRFLLRMTPYSSVCF